MNPHRLTWGFAYNLPFAQIVAIFTLIAMIIHFKKLYRFPVERVTIALVIFVLWLCVSPWFSFQPDEEFKFWERAIKIQLMVLAAFLLVGNRDQLHKLVWVLALSVGFYGIKGGIFTIFTGGQYRVWGPAGSFIADNNALALAIIMVVPLFRYLQLHSSKKWIKVGCVAAMLLCIVSVFGSRSRGALLALAAMGMFLFTKSRQKSLIAFLATVGLVITLVLMPESWYERMASIKTYEQDASALGRINAWQTAWNVAVDRFPIGGGFAMWTESVYARYSPNPNMMALVAHSIYFHVLGDHGFIGLALFLLVFGLAWLDGSWVIRQTKNKPEFVWAYDLASMCQVSLVGYAVGGAFLSLTYFDLPYYLVVILVVLRRLIGENSATNTSAPQAVAA